LDLPGSCSPERLENPPPHERPHPLAGLVAMPPSEDKSATGANHERRKPLRARLKRPLPARGVSNYKKVAERGDVRQRFRAWRRTVSPVVRCRHQASGA